MQASAPPRSTVPDDQRTIGSREAAIASRTKDSPSAGGSGRSHQGKPFIAGTVGVGNGGPGRIQAQIADYSARNLHAFLAANLSIGATARTKGWATYPCNRNHDPRVVGAIATHIVLPWVHRVFSNLKTRALNVYHGLRPQHLQAYLGKFVFRFNRRRTRHAAFRSSTVAFNPATY